FLALDIGNSFTKVGLFRESLTPRYARVSTAQLETALPEILESWAPPIVKAAGWVSVSHDQALADWPVWQKWGIRPRPVRSTDHLPVVNAYATPETLGPDRIVAAIGAWVHSGRKPVLVIDAGTALTFDCIDGEGTYRGGAIAPGLHMRFQALNQFTAKLPLVEAEDDPPLVGDSTHSSIRSGVINGMRAELFGTIEAYRPILGSDMQVYLTGGDTSYFVNHLKSSIFADPYLVLRGVHYILIQQHTI
ncbi:MAG: type III pantothenate kinase, partial [Bacteroidota bacterium]